MTDRDLQQKRIMAGLIDIGITIGVCLVLGLMVGVVGGIVGSTSTVGEYISRILFFLFAAALLGFVLGRDIVAGDRSLGKKTQDLRVVTTTGAPITFAESARRNAIF